jgi:hypothetical protein
MFPPDTSTSAPNRQPPSIPGNSGVPPTLLPLPGKDKNNVDDGSNYVHYDEKWNVDETPTEEPDSNNPKLAKCQCYKSFFLRH